MADLGPDDTVLCTATMGFGPLRAFVEAAGSAGFDAISLSGGDYKSARFSRMSDADIRALLGDNGIRVAELDGIVDWLRPLPVEQGAGYGLDNPFFGHTQSEFLDIAAAVDARSITAVDPFMGHVALDDMVDAFARLCDRAAAFGLLVHLEFLSWGPVADLATAWDIVRLADRPNGGLVLDTLHLVRSGSMDCLAGIQADKIFATQFCDATAKRVLDPFTDAANRLWPGEGELSLGTVLRQIRDGGCRAPLGIEVMNEETRSMEPAAIARRALAALRAIQQ